MRALILPAKIDRFPLGSAPARFWRISAALGVISLSACATTAPGVKIETVQIKIPVPVSCVSADQIPPEPAKTTLTGQAGLDVQLVASQALRYRGWGRELSALLSGCADLPPIH